MPSTCPAESVCCRPAQKVTGAILGGHRSTLTDGDLRERLIDVVLAPLLSRYGRPRSA